MHFQLLNYMRYLLLILLFILPFKNQAQFNFVLNSSTIKEYEQNLKIYNHDEYYLYVLTQNKNYDSIISLCYAKIKENQYAQNIETYHAFLASTYYLKGRKDSAYDCAFNFLKERSLGNFDVDDVLYYSNYMLFYPLASDENFQKKILDFYIAEYIKGYFPNKILATLLIELGYYDYRIRKLDEYSNLTIKDSVKRKEMLEKNEQFKQMVETQYLAILKYHPDIIKEAEVGSVFRNQFTIMDDISNDSIRKTILQPMLKRALDKKEIAPYYYVNHLSRTAIFNSSIKPEELQSYSDSLCKKFNCRLIFQR